MDGGIDIAIITFLLIGWILNWFKFEGLVIQAFRELFNKDITKASTISCFSIGFLAK